MLGPGGKVRLPASNRWWTGPTPTWGLTYSLRRSFYVRCGEGDKIQMTTECETAGCMHQKRLHGSDGHCRACGCSDYTRTGPGHQTKAARKQIAQSLRKW